MVVDGNSACKNINWEDFSILFVNRPHSLRCIVLTTLNVEILLILRAAVKLFIQELETDTLNSPSHESLVILCLQNLANYNFVASSLHLFLSATDFYLLIGAKY